MEREGGRGGWAAAPSCLALLASAAWVGAEPPVQPLTPREARVFQQVCAHCHVQPGIGVPLLGDEAEWAARRARGFDTLLVHTVEGRGGMPPLGTCGFCTEEDLRRLVAFLAGYARVPGTEGGAR